MAEQRQQHGLPHHADRQVRFAQLLRLVADMQRGSSPKGMIINGVSGIGKTLGVVTYLQKDQQ